MEVDDGESAGESTNASWVNPEDLGEYVNFMKFSGRRTDDGCEHMSIGVRASINNIILLYWSVYLI